MSDKIYTRKEILANREKWIEKLLKPRTKKATGRLDDGDGERCCLGHACSVLKINKFVDTMFSGTIHYGRQTGEEDFSDSELPYYVADMLGMKTDGGFYGVDYIEFVINGEKFDMSGLMSLNDDTDASPQFIGQWLKERIQGGVGTPFKPLTDYPE